MGPSVSEAQLLERCKEMVERCRLSLEELRAHVKAARSHREKCSKLLAAATTAVMNLEALLWSPDIDVAKEKRLQQLCTQVQVRRGGRRADRGGRRAGRRRRRPGRGWRPYWQGV